MGHRFDPSEWLKVDRRAQTEERRSAQRDIEFLRHHTWADIYARGEFTFNADDGDDPETFAQATHRILKSRLAIALVASGYINDYFALYVSVFYGEHLRPRALNYIVHVLDRGVADIHAELDGDDVEAIIGDKGTDIFRDRAAYNITVLDHLLANRRAEAAMIVRQVAAWDRTDRDFGQAYIQTGRERVRFVRLLAPLLPETIASIVTDAPEEGLAEVIDAALGYAGSDIGMPETSEFAELVIENYERFPSITDASRDGSINRLPRKQTIDAIARLGIQLPATAPLNSIARGRVIELGAYVLSAENIANLTAQPSLALDAIRVASEPVFSVALGRATEYLALIAERDGAVTVEDPQTFLPILNHADDAGVDGSHLSRIVEEASVGCRVDLLTDAPASVWPTLAATNRTVPSARNLLDFSATFGVLDGIAGWLLADVKAIEGAEDVSEAERVQLAVAVLNARQAIPSAAHRVALAASLHLPSPLSADSLTPESGEIVGLMIEAGLLSDDEATFASALIADWPTREAALFRSMKKAALTRLEVLLPEAGPEAIRGVADFAASADADIPLGTIGQLRAGGASDHERLPISGGPEAVGGHRRPARERSAVAAVRYRRVGLAEGSQFGPDLIQRS